MATTLTINGTAYSFPQTGDENWGENVTGWASAVTSGMLQKAGGTFTLTAEIDFGATFGIKASYVKSRATNPGSAGIVRLGNAESITWRNALNTGDLSLTVNASNLLAFNGTALQSVISVSDTSTIDLTLTGAAIEAAVIAGSLTNSHISASAAIAYSKLALTGSIVNADISASATIAYSKLALTGSLVNADISASAAIAHSKMAALTVSRALTSDASGVVSVSAVTSTELGYVSGVTSAIQTQIDTKAAAADLTSHTGNTSNPHSVTKAQVGLGSVDNTSDLAKPISTATQTALDAKAAAADLTAHTSATTSVHGIANTADLTLKSTLTTKGDLYVATGAGAVTRVGVGTDGQVLIADSTLATGVKWAAAGAGDFLASGTVPMTGQFLASTSALATAPPITFSGDPDTGIVHPAANTIGLATNGTERFRLANDGNLSAVVANGTTLYPGFLCRAFVRFNGNTNSITSSGNVSSLTDNGTADWSLNFSTAMPDTTYACVGIANVDVDTSQSNELYPIAFATGSVRVINSPGGTKTERDHVSVLVFR